MDGNMIVVVVPNEHREEVERTLLDARFQAIPVPNETGSPAERLKVHARDVEEASRGIG
ncbi:MAG: hypothetical protein RQM90_06150 [Methanoculleus sp.]